MDFDAHVRTESARFGEVLRRTDPAARVPSCPEWSAGDLHYHLAEVHHYWAVIVRDAITDEDYIDTEVEANKPPRPDEPGELAELYDRTTADLLDSLAGADDATAVWTWASDQSVGFVRRFQAHEALMHRVDAELAAGDLTALPTDLAADGIEVVLRFQKTWRPGWADWQLSDAVGRIAAADTGDEWFVRLGAWSGNSPDTGKTYAAVPALDLVESAAPTFTVSAAAADLDAWLWNRPGFGAVDTSGDAAHLERFRAMVTDGVQ